MSRTLTIRINSDLARWIETTSARMGVSQGQLIRAQIERAKSRERSRSFMRLAGAVRLAKDLSSRKGFSRE